MSWTDWTQVSTSDSPNQSKQIQLRSESCKCEPTSSEIGNDCLHYIKDYFSLAQKSACPRSQEYSGRGKNKNLDFLSLNLPLRQLKPNKYLWEGDMQAPCQIGKRRGKEFDIVTGQIFSSSWEHVSLRPLAADAGAQRKGWSLFLYLLKHWESIDKQLNQSINFSHPLSDIPGGFTSDTNYTTHPRWFSNTYR